MIHLSCNTLKILGRLLAYPKQDFLQAIPECKEILDKEALLSAEQKDRLFTFMDALTSRDILDTQESYVGHFDRTPSLSLHLFEHVHGDSKDRGKALADLSDMYAESGYEIAEAETPDFLPLFLEFSGTLHPDQAMQHLAAISHILLALSERLKERSSEYAVIFENLLSIVSSAYGDRFFQTAQPLVEKKDATTFDELDNQWEEQFAFDSLQEKAGSGCPQAQNMLNRMTKSMAGG